MISHSKKFIFVHPHRTGGSSIELSLKRFSDQPIKYRKKYGVSDFPFKHARIPEFIENKLITEEEYKNFFKFAIVRNPWDRAISWYFWRLKINRENYSKELLEKNNGEPVFDRETFVAYQYIDKEFKLPPLVEDLMDINGNFDINIYDDIIKEETIQDDFNRICNKLYIPNIKIFPFTVPPYGGTNHKYYKEYYDKELINIIKEVYSEDIKQFNYEW